MAIPILTGFGSVLLTDKPSLASVSGDSCHAILSISSLLLCATCLKRLGRKFRTAAISSSRKPTLKQWSVALLQVYGLYTGVSLYAWLLFPLIPPSFGGGTLQAAFVYFKKDKLHTTVDFMTAILPNAPPKIQIPMATPLADEFGVSVYNPSVLLRVVSMEGDFYIFTTMQTDDTFWEQLSHTTGPQIWRVPKEDVDFVTLLAY